jgi:hypothetical protein
VENLLYHIQVKISDMQGSGLYTSTTRANTAQEDVAIQTEHLSLWKRLNLSDLKKLSHTKSIYIFKLIRFQDYVDLIKNVWPGPYDYTSLQPQDHQPNHLDHLVNP